jgi:hypothetical protein
MKPGAGTYFIDGGDNNLADKSFPIEEARTFAQSEKMVDSKKKIPGPAYYKAIKEPKKISFLFNPSEKWV